MKTSESGFARTKTAQAPEKAEAGLIVTLVEKLKVVGKSASHAADKKAKKENIPVVDQLQVHAARKATGAKNLKKEKSND